MRCARGSKLPLLSDSIRIVWSSRGRSIARAPSMPALVSCCIASHRSTQHCTRAHHHALSIVCHPPVHGRPASHSSYGHSRASAGSAVFAGVATSAAVQRSAGNSRCRCHVGIHCKTPCARNSNHTCAVAHHEHHPGVRVSLQPRIRPIRTSSTYASVWIVACRARNCT
jgi:hypothetical protein